MGGQDSKIEGFGAVSLSQVWDYPENRLLIVINKVVVLLIAAFNQLDHIDFKAHEIKAGIQ